MNVYKLKQYIRMRYQKDASPNLTYHGFHHTLDVLNACNLYIVRYNIQEHPAVLLRTAALLHDIGIIYDYFNHEWMGTLIAKELLPEWGYGDDDIETVCSMIMATKIPQSPSNMLEKILCDSDLDYLGSDHFYATGQSLFRELTAFQIVHSEEEWDRMQISFLQNHQYHTDFALRNREPVKRMYLQEIKARYGW